jgi:hypothetical protein
VAKQLSFFSRKDNDSTSSLCKSLKHIIDILIKSGCAADTRSTYK